MPLYQRLHPAKKLLAILTISTLMIINLEALQHVLCIGSLVQSPKRQLIRVLINSGSKINAMTLAYAVKLGFTTQKISIGAQKIDSLLLKLLVWPWLVYCSKTARGEFDSLKRLFYWPIHPWK